MLPSVLQLLMYEKVNKIKKGKEVYLTLMNITNNDNRKHVEHKT